MSRETKEKKIGEHTYYVTQMGAIEGRRVFARLVKIFAPMASGGTVEERIARVAAEFTEEDVDFFCDVFAKTTTVSGVAYGTKQPRLVDVVDVHFVASYEYMVQWLAFALGVNYEGFFRGLGGNLENSVAENLSP